MKQFPISIVRFPGKSGRTLILLGLLLAGFVAYGQQLVSPHHNLSLTFNLTSQGAPMYALTYKGKTVLKPSLRASSWCRKATQFRVLACERGYPEFRRNLDACLGRQQPHPQQTITSSPSRYTRRTQTARYSFGLGSSTTVSVFGTSSLSRQI
jgi:hypothetical protein